MLSLFDLFKVGIGPSSSHTVGPMLAGLRFAEELAGSGASFSAIQVDLFGSLALTGKGHATDTAVLAGLMGLHPATVDIDDMHHRLKRVQEESILSVMGKNDVPFQVKRDLRFHFDKFLPYHPNAVTFQASNGESTVVLERTFYSVGGGFVVRDDETSLSATNPSENGELYPFPFHSGEQLLQICLDSNLRIDEVVHRNERVRRSEEEIAIGCDRLWNVMQECIDRGCKTAGFLPGGLKVERRAPKLYRRLKTESSTTIDPLQALDWVSLYALAVNEENAAGGRVVTAPTNGAAGVIPAVLSYYVKFVPGANREGVHRFLKTAAAIGMLYKRNASLSAAEMGCQGEVGVACSMAAAGLAAVMNGTVQQVENAAEIGMEHNLGLTCDPVGGLVQIPCIERNTMGATKAINAARLAVLYGDGSHCVSLDRVIETMRQTGVDMQSKYKETSLGGLAVNVVNC